jgi:hypothetical protein
MMTLGNMRENGTRWLRVQCGCGHAAPINADRWPDTSPVPLLRTRLRCTVCNARPKDVIPDWTRREGRIATANDRSS